MDDLLKEMGKRIHDRRKQLHMTQERLAELAGITPQTVSTAELGAKGHEARYNYQNFYRP